MCLSKSQLFTSQSELLSNISLMFLNKSQLFTSQS